MHSRAGLPKRLRRIDEFLFFAYLLYRLFTGRGVTNRRQREILPALYQRSIRRRGGEADVQFAQSFQRRNACNVRTCGSFWRPPRRAGTVWINEWHLLNERAPFGGYKQSGIGREFGLDGLKEFTETKHIHVDLAGSRDKKPWYDIVVPRH
jgi:hypothetical protein